MRWVVNMLVNLAGPALAWSLFFKDKNGIDGTRFPENFVNMGIVFSLGILVFVVSVLLSTRKYMADNNDVVLKNSERDNSFWNDIKNIFLDKYARIVFSYTFFVVLGSVIVTCVQVYMFIHFMKFTAAAKTVVSSASMLGFMTGAALCSLLVKRFDKKKAVVIAVCVGAASNFVLGFLLLTGILSPNASFSVPQNVVLLAGLHIPVAIIIFIIFHFGFWLGNGIMSPIGTAMIADISEINERVSGVLKDGSYAAVYTFLVKASMSVGIFLSGYILSYSGFVTGSENQTERAITNLAYVFFFGGPLIMLISLLLLLKYPVDRNFVKTMKTSVQK
jgi:GPH family glycoside/pentoside/hexuronide:cation symporter